MKNRATWVGAALGVALYLAGLGLHIHFAGLPLRAHPGVPDPGYLIINLPAGPLGQGIGKVDAATAEAREKRWSPVAFVALGLMFYAGVGGLAGFAVGRARRKVA